MISDTIAAISTAPGDAGISIVRLSGPESLRIADMIFDSSGEPPSRRPDRTLTHGAIGSAQGVLDEVILLVMRSPHSYTREDVVEIQTHGGAVCARRILRRLLDCGARPAEAGEFTKRAFLNGRIDLLQAEAVLDLVRARSDRAAQSALEQLQGRLSSTFDMFYTGITDAASQVEATFDFGEDNPLLNVAEETAGRLEVIAAEMNRTLSTWEEGQILREGALVVISGKPNTGKSTLLNTLLGRERAIVSSTPGTTRDTIEESFILGGYLLRLVDTAGLRETHCEVEGHGVRRALLQAGAADLRLHLCDGSQALGDADRDAFHEMNPSAAIVVLTKSDLTIVTDPGDCGPITARAISCLSGEGIDELKNEMLQKLGLLKCPGPGATISERHRRNLSCALENVSESAHLLRCEGQDFVPVAASRLRRAAEEIGVIIGRTYTEDLLDAVFSRFCVGK